MSKSGNLNMWTVGIISTSNDLSDVREKLSYYLKKEGFSSVMFEKNYERRADEDIDVTCARNISNVDYVILLVGDRYGSVIHRKGISQTENEYNVAIKNKIPVLRMIRKDVFELYQASLHNSNNSKLPNAEYSECLRKIVEKSASLRCPTNEKELRNVIEFIGRMRPQQKWFERVDFTNINAIKEHVKRFLKEPYNLMSKIAMRQMEKIYMTQTHDGSTVLDLEKFYIPPEFEDVKAKSTSFISNEGDQGRRIKITGGGGSGKSSLLMYSYISHAKGYCNHARYETAPLFIKSNLYDLCSGECIRLVDDVCKIELLKSKHPYSKFMNGINICIYLDSIDEDPHYLDSIDDCLKYLNKFHSIILTCRSDQIGRINHSLNRIGGRELKIPEFTENIINKLVDEHAANDSLPPENVERIKEIFKRYKVSNPLVVSLIIKLFGRVKYIWNNENVYVQSALHTRLANELIDSNHSRMCGINHEIVANLDLDLYKKIIRDACWNMYITREFHSENVNLNGVLDTLMKKYNLDENTILEILKPFMIIEHDVVNPIHMLFIEYFAADWIVQDLLAGGKEFKNYVGYAIRSQVQRFMGSMFRDLNEEKRRTIYEWYSKEYYENKNNNNHHKTTYILYYVPRLIVTGKGLDIEIIDFLKHELNHWKESGRYLETIPIFNWLIQLNDLNAEQEYYELLTKNKEFNKLNRGCYLVYQGDLPAGIKFPYEEIEVNIKYTNWGKTFNSFREHFYDSNEVRHKFLRRIDLTILNTFVDAGYKLDSDMISFINEMGKDLKDYTFDKTFKEKLLTMGVSCDKFMDGICAAYRDLKTSINAKLIGIYLMTLWQIR